MYNQSMGRKSVREERRAELTRAFARVLATHGYAGATIAAVAEEAAVAPGLVHHHFASKHDLLESLLDDLMDRFRRRAHRFEDDERVDPLDAYLSAALALDGTADTVAARCWVGVLAEAVREPALFARMRRLLDGEIGAIQRRAGGRLRVEDASAVLAFVLGALMFGAFAPRKTSGFAAPAARAFARALVERRSVAEMKGR
jgi:TetR/AcrR family transcriptional repressor of bet genes